jgi:hypothetical protein
MRDDEHVPIQSVQQARLGGLIDRGCGQKRGVLWSLECGPGSWL